LKTFSPFSRWLKAGTPSETGTRLTGGNRLTGTISAQAGQKTFKKGKKPLFENPSVIRQDRFRDFISGTVLLINVLFSGAPGADNSRGRSPSYPFTII